MVTKAASSVWIPLSGKFNKSTDYYLHSEITVHQSKIPNYIVFTKRNVISKLKMKFD